jgi:hypothetical protein
METINIIQNTNMNIKLTDENGKKRIYILPRIKFINLR